MKIIKSVKKQDWPSFILTLIATLIGVFVAIILTDIGAVEKEQNDTIKLLNTSKIIVTETLSYTEKLNSYIDTLQQDSSNYDELRLKRVQTQNPIPYPDLLEEIIASELVLKNMSEFSHSIVYTNIMNIKKLASYKTISYYKRMLDELLLILTLEIKYQQGKVSIEDLDAMFNKEQSKLDQKYELP